MNEQSIADLKAILGDLDPSVLPGGASVPDVLRKIEKLLEPLLGMRGYTLSKFKGRPGDWGFDFVARKGATTESGEDELLIAYKHYQRASVDADSVSRYLDAARWPACGEPCW